MSAERRLLRPASSVSHSSVVVSAGLLFSALLGASQGLLLVFIVGEGSDTDAFLAAYSLYVVFAILGGSLRASIVPVLGAHESDEAFRQRASELLSRVFLIGAALMTTLLVISTPAGQLLTLGLPADDRWTAVESLAVLSLAAFMQFYGAAQSAVLAGARRFTFSSSLYVISGAIALGTSAALLALIGVVGAAFGLVCGAVVLAGGHGAYIRSHGVTPRPVASMFADRAQRELAVVLLSAASISVALQLSLAIALGSLSHDPGAITAYSYAFFIVGLTLSISSFAIGLVTIPELVEDLARRGVDAARTYVMEVPRYAFAVLVPALVAFAVDGKPLLDAVFADALSDRLIDIVYDVGLVLSISAAPSTLLFLTGGATLALGRARVLIPLSLVTLAIQAALVLPLSSISPVAVAAGHTATLTIASAILLRLLFGTGWSAVALGALRRMLPALPLSLAFLAARAPFGEDAGVVEALAAGALGLVVYVLLAVALWPSVSTAFLGIFRRA
jgi:peptidoglycan biosynthesis protein MviN/MurJ (putative lipid II flippase)